MEEKTNISSIDVDKTKDEDIDLISLAKILWNGRNILLISIAFFGALGIIIALLTPNTFTAKSILVPQLKTDAQSGLSGLAALAGINVGISQSSSEVSPLIYPLIIKSIPFQLDLINTPLKFKKKSSLITYLNFVSSVDSTFSLVSFLKKYTIGLPSVIKGIINGGRSDNQSIDGGTKIIWLTNDQKYAVKSLDNVLVLTMNSKEGYVTLTATMHEPVPAAQMAQRAADLLQRYIIDFKIKKSKDDLDFIQERFNEKKIEFERAQENLAIRIDRNKNFTSGLSSVETDRMQTKYTLTLEVYQELAKQLEQAKIQVKKETPVFSVIEPVTIPSEKSRPNRFLILLIWIAIGALAGIAYVYTKSYLNVAKEIWIK